MVLSCRLVIPKSEIVLVKETSNGEYRLKDLDTKNPSIAKAEDSFELRNGVAGQPD